MNTFIISKLIKLKVNAFDITENNYMTWAVGAKMHLEENEFLEIIDKLKTISDEKTIKLWYLHGLDAGL